MFKFENLNYCHQHFTSPILILAISLSCIALFVSFTSPNWNLLLHRHHNNGHHQAPCHRYAFVRRDPAAGLGHQFGDLVFGYIFALETNSSFVLEDWNSDLDYSNPRHYSFDIKGFLGLGNLPTLDSIIKLKLHHHIIPRWTDANDNNLIDACNILLETCDQCCVDHFDRSLKNTYWCFLRKISAYDTAKTFFRTKYRLSSNYQPTTNRFKVSDALRFVSVAYHVRIGDITVKHSAAPDYFHNVMQQLNLLLSGPPTTYHYQLYVFSDGPLDNDTFGHISNYSPVYVNDLSAEDTLHHLIHADILVTSGSSFAAMAAVLNENLVLQSMSKDGVLGIYEVTDQFVLATREQSSTQIWMQQNAAHARLPTDEPECCYFDVEDNFHTRSSLQRK